MVIARFNDDILTVFNRNSQSYDDESWPVSVIITILTDN